MYKVSSNEKEIVEVFNTETEEIENRDRYKQDYECYSKVDLMKYLIEEYTNEGEADE